MAYPDTLLRIGQLDAIYGGQAANDFGGPAWDFVHGVLHEASRQLLEAHWLPYRTIRAKVSDGATAGDVVIYQLAGVEVDYTVRKVTGVTYDPDITPWVGILAEPVSAGALGKIITAGPGIPPTITGLAAGGSGELTFDTGTGRLRLRVGGEPLVGWVNAQAYAMLLARAEG